jgi:hypothetical protein
VEMESLRKQAFCFYLKTNREEKFIPMNAAISGTPGSSTIKQKTNTPERGASFEETK